MSIGVASQDRARDPHRASLVQCGQWPYERPPKSTLARTRRRVEVREGVSLSHGSGSPVKQRRRWTFPLFYCALDYFVLIVFLFTSHVPADPKI